MFIIGRLITVHGIELIEPISKLQYKHKPLMCHSGLSGIFLCFQKDSRRASLAGMTTLNREPILRQVLYIVCLMVEYFSL